MEMQFVADISCTLAGHFLSECDQQKCQGTGRFNLFVSQQKLQVLAICDKIWNLCLEAITNDLEVSCKMYRTVACGCCHSC